MSEIVRLYRMVKSRTLSNPRIFSEISTSLTQLAASAMARDVSSNLGYCYRFSIPTEQVRRVIATLGLEEKELVAAFQRDFGHPGEARMLNDPYYLVLLFLCFIAVQEHRPQLFDDAFFLVLIKLWNGRRTRYLPYCNPEYMRYAVTMVSRRYQISKPEHSSPSLLLRNYFLPTLKAKYQDAVRSDPRYLKRLFTQAYLRIKQIFVQRVKYDPDKQMKVAQGGLLKLYMDAREKGGRISSVPAGTESDFQQQITGSRIDELIKKSVRSLVYGGTSYSQDFVTFLNQKTKVSERVIREILAELRLPVHQATVEELYVLFYGRIKPAEVCSNDILELVKKRIISSKNNDWSRRFVKALETLILTLKPLQDVYPRYSHVQRMQIRNVIIYVLVYHARKALCGKDLV